MKEVDGLSVGPFDVEPVELGRVVSDHFSPAVSGDEIYRRSEEWLVDVLARYGVVLGHADRETVRMLAGEGWSSVQIVAGWIARARKLAESSITPPLTGSPHVSPGSTSGEKASEVGIRGRDVGQDGDARLG